MSHPRFVLSNFLKIELTGWMMLSLFAIPLFFPILFLFDCTIGYAKNNKALNNVKQINLKYEHRSRQ